MYDLHFCLYKDLLMCYIASKISWHSNSLKNNMVRPGRRSDGHFAAGTTICIVSLDSSKLSTVWIGQLCGQLYRIMALPNIAYDYCNTSMTSKFRRSWDRNRSFAITSGIKQGCVLRKNSFRKLCRSIVAPPSDTEWPLEWHDIHLQAA